jgi:hypothetical protein
MSNRTRTIDEPKPAPSGEAHDPLLAALRELPSRSLDDSVEARLQRQARAAYVRSFEGAGWQSSAAGLLGRAAVPVFLAGVVGLYMTWAIAAATALVH